MLYLDYYDSFEELASRKLITFTNVKRLAKSGLSLEHMQRAYEHDSQNGIAQLLSHPDVTGRPRVDDVPRLTKLFESLFAKL